MPSATGSATCTKTIGIVWVSPHQRQHQCVVDEDDVGFHSMSSPALSGRDHDRRQPNESDAHVAAVGPPRFPRLFLQSRDVTLPLWIVLGEDGEHADPAHLLTLRAREERPRSPRR